MNAERDDILDALRAELAAVEPSGAFAAGVRARADARSGAGFRLQFALATATVAIAVVAGGAYWLQQGTTVAPVPTQAVAQSVPAPAAQPALTPAPAAQPTQRGSVTKPVSAPVTAEASAGPFLEVITNQPEMIRRVWTSIDGGMARVGLPANEFTEIAVVPVTVDAIVVPKIGAPGGGGSVPGARRVVVDESARGDQR